MITLHMETNIVRNSTQQMRQSTTQMMDLLQSISSNAQSAEWIGPSYDEFISEVQRVTQEIKTQTETLSTLASRAEREVTEWENIAASLEGIYGDLLEKIRDVSLLASITSMSGVASGVASSMIGDVLGVSTTIDEIALSGAGTLSAEEQKVFYQGMSWSDKFEEQKSIGDEIIRVNGLLPQDAEGKLDELDNRIADIDKKIVALQEQRDIAEKKSNGLFNQVIPDFPLERDKEDGLPWRVRADDYEDEIENYDKQLTTLKQQQSNLADKRSSIQGNIEQLAYLNKQKSTLDTVITNGVTRDGPSPKYPYFPGTDANNCTKYASGQRNLPVSGHAYQWNDQAAAGDYDVGNIPVKNSVIVFEPDPNGSVSNSKYGHVAVVDQVKSLGNNQYEINISEGGWDGGTKVNHRTITVDASSKSSSYKDVPVSYIYEKISE